MQQSHALRIDNTVSHYFPDSVRIKIVAAWVVAKIQYGGFESAWSREISSDEREAGCGILMLSYEALIHKSIILRLLIGLTNCVD